MRNGLQCNYRTNNNGQYCGKHGGLTLAGYREFHRATEGRGFFVSDIGDITDYIKSLTISKIERDCCVLDECIICLDIVSNSHYNLTCCNTNFCKTCLDKWYNISKSCPHCRA